jgi:hypothetical protein
LRSEGPVTALLHVRRASPRRPPKSFWWQTGSATQAWPPGENTEPVALALALLLFVIVLALFAAALIASRLGLLGGRGSGAQPATSGASDAVGKLAVELEVVRHLRLAA